MRNARSAVLLGALVACSARPSEPPANTPPEAPSAPVASAPTPELPPPMPEPPPPPTVPGGGPDPLSLTGAASTSIGTPVEGRLEGGVPLPLHGPGYRFNPAKNPAARHGTVEVVQAIVRAAAVVHQAFPDRELVVGDLAMPEGGDIPGHASHRSGRDVDFLFYLLDEDGEPRPPKAIPIEPDLHGVDYGDLSTAEDDVRVEIDLPATWAFLEALVSLPEVAVNRIFIVEHLRDALLDHARRIGAPAAAIERVGHLTCQPGFPHDDHMHVRFFCSAEDIARGCQDTRPFYPWHLQALAAQGVEPVLAGKRKNPRPALTSVAGAEAKAAAKYGAFHPEVEAFLERRKAWARPPRPGRKYCR